MKKFFLSISFIALYISSFSQIQNNLIDVKKYTISLDFKQMNSNIISGNTKITFVTEPEFSNLLSFELLGLEIDSIIYSLGEISYTYNDSVIEINLSSYNQNQELDITVYYHGQPLMGENSFGGFYFTNGYAFNMGVSLYDVPHNYGKVWFPCVDNFTDKAKYHYFIETDSIKTAVCNGELINIDTLSNKNKIFEWVLNEEISSYLASVAVANFQKYEDIYQGINRDIPISIYAVNISNVANSFANLKSALSIFENLFGEYKWNKVGYVIVPFNAGAMEHATNIAIGTYMVNGSITYEDIFYHELAHSWFGNLITCSSAEDMWINEGLTSYCETIFQEFFYGTENAKLYRRNAHFAVIKDLSYEDGGFISIAPMSQELTYSETVYEKGASVTHALRSYLGDSLFFNSFKQLFNNNAFKNLSSIELRDSLSLYSGVNLNDFFNDWVFTGGFVHYEIDSVGIISSNQSTFSCKVYLRQKLRGRDNFANSNRVELTFMDTLFNTQTRIFEFNGQYGEQIFNFENFFPIRVFCDFNEKISDATIDFYKYIKNTGTNTYAKTYAVLHVQNIVDSVLIRITQSFVEVDTPSSPINGIELLNNRYWLIEGIINDDFRSKADFSFNNIQNQHLDYEYINGNIDSLLLLYRPNKKSNWIIDKDATLYKTNRKFTVDSLKLGEYCIGIYNHLINSNLQEDKDSDFMRINPNPAKDSFVLSFNDKINASVQIYNTNGKKMFSKKINSNKIEIQCNKFNKGNYIVEVIDTYNIKKHTSKLLITR